MSETSFGDSVLDAAVGRIKQVAALPTVPSDYYGAGAVGHDQWLTGEAVYLTTDEKLYIQTATGYTATWKVLNSAFATSTTSSTTSSSSSTTSSSSSTSSTSSSTSTSSSSSSTSSSSTTTMS